MTPTRISRSGEVELASIVVNFPNPVNEKAARVVAGCVALLAALTLLTRAEWLIVVLAVGFGLRVLAGPRFSPLGLLATRIVAPRLGEPVLVPGPPKRFAQAIGLAMTTTAAMLAIVLEWTTAAFVLIAVLLVFAVLEAVVGFCAGCWLFGILMRAGVVPEETCVACNDIWNRPRLLSPQTSPGAMATVSEECAGTQ